MTNIVVAFHSGYGNTERAARAVAAGAGADLVRVDTIDAGGWSLLDAADAVVFGCPTYMGGPSAPFKAFADATSGIYANRSWQDKLAAGFTNSGSLNGDKLATLQYLAQFAAQHGMQWAPLGLGSVAENRLGAYLGLMTQSADGVTDPADLAAAESFGARLRLLAARWTGSLTAVSR
ncbi:flavodoxin family protein [Dactylosporangium sp. NPDC005572]|uniref:flavodoxin family protein n=1 Tax=Dactylosporangium sp. NPDC005572 TaxID=3156889 RepID=UPI0033A6DBF5